MLSKVSKNQMKKYLSAFLIFAIFFGQTVQIPVIQVTQAASSDAPNLVSVIVSSDTNSGALKSRIKRYADDIQAAMPNTRVTIVEVPDNIAPHNIAALNEKLYYQGDGNGISRLVGTVLIGSLPLPVVHNGSKSFLSIYPYVDFDDKVFVYNSETGYYEASKTPVTRDVPEIWHGVIMPNTGNADSDRDRIAKFLDKTHDFYTSQGVFSESMAEPSVFYLDAYHDQQSTSLPDWKAYNLYLDNLEDIAYNRFNKHLAKTLYESYQGFLENGNDGSGATDPAIAALNEQLSKDTIDFSNTPDIQTRSAILKSVKQFLEVFNSKYLGDVLKFAYNTGRYGDGTNVRADIAPVLVSKQDQFMKQSLKDANSLFESNIDQLVKNGLSRDIAVPSAYSYRLGTPTIGDTSPHTFHNYLFGMRADSIASAKDCSIVRGSSLPVEANRGYDVLNAPKDVEALRNASVAPNVGLPGAGCFASDGTPRTIDTWGGNSPLNLNASNLSAAELKDISSNSTAENLAKYSGKLSTKLTLKNNKYSGYIAPTFDIAGSSEITPSTTLPVNSPADCSKTDFLADPYSVEETDELGRNTSYYYPDASHGSRFTCLMYGTHEAPTGHKTWSGAPLDFATLYADKAQIPSCTVEDVQIGGKTVKNIGSPCIAQGGDGALDSTTYETRDYKRIPSWIEHKSPTDEEFSAILSNLATPSLPADKDRYIDFVSAKGNVVKIAYPNFYRLAWTPDEEVTADKAKAKIREMLDAKSAEINQLIDSENPQSLDAGSKKAYDFLKSGAYPTTKVDLYKTLESNATVFASIVDSIVWYSLRNATSKYAFVLEHDLDRDGNVDYPIAGHKADYEMAYIGGLGDAKDLYLKIDPTAKGGPGPEITDIQNQNAALTNLLDGANVSDFHENQAKFKCGPPEGVPIWQWLPAVFCWLGSIMPPTITSGSCGAAPTGNRAIDSNYFTAISTHGDGVPDWQQDRNNNGILDGYEWIANGKLDLAADHKHLSYGMSTPIRATLMKDGKVLAFDSFNSVQFDVKRVVAYDANGKSSVVYAKNASGSLSQVETLQQYVTFTPIAVRADSGVAEYSIQGKNSDVDVILEATVAPKDKNGNTAFTKVSNELTIEVRGDTLDIASTATIGGEKTPVSSVAAGDADAINFAIAAKNSAGTSIALGKPVELNIYDDVDNTLLDGPTKIASDSYSYKGALMTKAGTYRFEFTDTNGRFASKVITILPAKPNKLIAVPSSNIFVRGEKDTVAVWALDKFSNLAKGNLLKVDASISGGGYFLDNKDSKTQMTTIDGVTNFDLTSNNGGENETVKFKLEDSNLEATVNLQSVEGAKIDVQVDSGNNIVVGKDAHEVHIRVLDKNGAVLDGFSGVASLDFPQNSGELSTSFVSIKNGVNAEKVTLTPKYLAGENLPLDIQIPGIKDISGNSVTVLPDQPMRVGLEADSDTLEARTGVKTGITAKLFDRYGNLAYNHASGMQATFSVPAESSRYGSVTAANVTFQRGVARTELAMSNVPGTLYYEVSVSPGLEGNKFTVTDQSGANLTISGYSKNVAFVETYYLWNKEKLQKTNYNALYTTLLGADYGNVTEQDYLGGEILFAPDSRSLAVTSTLNDASQKDEVFSLTPGGKLEQKGSGDSLARLSLESRNGRSSVSVYDPFLRENIARVHLNLAQDTSLVACDADGNETIDGCQLNSSDKYVLLKAIGSAKVTKGRDLGLEIDGTRVFSVDSNGNVTKYPSVSIELDADQTKNLLGFNIMSGTTKIGYLAMKWNASHVEVTDPDRLDATIAANPGTLVVEKISSRYRTVSTNLGNSSKGARGIVLYRTGNGSDEVDRDLVGSASKTGLEEYKTKQGIGFGNGSTSLLEFAAGSSVGEATKFASTYGMINLGDPVAHLSKLENAQGTYDRTVGQKLTDSLGGTIESYSRIDTNGDGYPDIVVFYDDGRIELIQNYAGTYKSLGYLAYVVDAGKDRKGTGDFAHDGFGDIAMVDKNGHLIVLDNQQGKFVRTEPRIFDESGKPTTIKGSIMQLETFDMDQDGFDDIVISDDSGELSILYGSKDDSGTKFTKKVLATDLGLRLTSEPTTSGGAMRWDGIQEVSAPTQDQYYAQSQQASQDPNGLSAADQKYLLDSKLYYIATNTRTVPAQVASNTRLNAIVGTDPENPGASNTDLVNKIKAGIADISSRAASGALDTSILNATTIEESRSYLKSEFLDMKNIAVSKTYNDENGGTLQAGDKVEIRLSITNSGSATLKNVAYLDANDANVFKLTDNPTYARKNSLGQTVGSGALTSLVDGPYDYTFDGFDLAPHETITIVYEMHVNPIAFGKFRVGALESDDKYGDVAMDANGLCGEAEILWKSVQPYPRSYTRTTKDVSTNADPSGQQKGLFTDFNHNGQPDYIDLISGEGSDYALSSSLWDSTKYGVLVFRQEVGTDGVPTSNVEVGRVVADAKKGYVQENAVSTATDIPVLATSDLVTGQKGDTWFGAGNASGNSSANACDANTKSLILQGWQQQMKDDPSDSTSSFSLSATAPSCSIQLGSNDPKGWKILTKASFKHYALVSQNADIQKDALGIVNGQTGSSGVSLFQGRDDGSIDLSGLSQANVDSINSSIDTLVKGLGCGFGGGSCLSMPLNWAPLAPGSAPVVMGIPLGPLSPSTGYPTFSSVTGLQTMCGTSPCCIPTVYPVSPLGYIPGPFCGPPSAGGYLGTWSPTNVFRLFVTPTITGAVGVAACYGGPAAAGGLIPPPGVSPLVPGGNCIVAAKPLLGCKDDGSDGDVSTLGGAANDNGFYNAGACRKDTDVAAMSTSDRSLIHDYLNGNDKLARQININASKAGGLGIPKNPLIGIGTAGHGQSGNKDFDVSVDFKAIKNFDLGSIVKVSHKRTSAFPDFLMDWVNRQLEEVVNKLTSLPTLYVILPDMRGVFESGWKGFTNNLGNSFSKGSSSYQDQSFSVGSSKYGAVNDVKQATNSALSGNAGTLNGIGRNVSGVKAAYEFLSRLPMLKFERSTLDITVPIISEEDLTKAETQWTAAAKQARAEVDSKKQKWGDAATEDGANKKVLLQADELVSGIESNVRTIQEYKKFPEKLSKYLTWKQRYASWALCNVESVEKLMGGWIADNGKRFRAWVELIVLIKAILKSWQIIPDLFNQYSAECSVCRNERHDAKYFIFKIISAIIPKIPIIKFPKWPDIVLDLHNIRLGLRIVMPEYHFNTTPIVLPRPPKLLLPDVPSLTIGLPGIPRLPPLPALPDLPTPPSLPSITLPELPPPPTLPKLFAAISATLNILKIVKKIMCILRTNPFVPEWRAGDAIAQITERQGKLNLDFLNIEYPQFDASFLDAIKVTTFVNLEFQVDFLLEMAKSTFAPFNSFTSDMSNFSNTIKMQNVDLRGTLPNNRRIDVGAGKTGFDSQKIFQNFWLSVAYAFRDALAVGARQAGESLSLDDFKAELKSNLLAIDSEGEGKVDAIKDELSRGLNYDGAAEQKFIQDLQADNTEKFRVAKDFIKSEDEENSVLKAKIEEVMTGKKTLADVFGTPSEHTLIAATTDTPSALPDFTKFDDRTNAAMLALSQPDPALADLKSEGEKLTTTVGNLTATAAEENSQIAAGETSVTATDSSLAGYEFRGIYMLDNGKQTRLFDYTDELTGDEKVVRTNSMKTGTDDLVYQIGDGLFLKRPLNGEEPKTVTDSIKTLDADDVLGQTAVPSAPNSFDERFTSTNEINFSFSPARKDTDNIFRLEFFDYIDRYDRMMNGEEPSQIDPKTVRSYVDLFPDLDNETVIDASKPSIILRKQTAYYVSGRGDATLSTPDIRTLGAGESIQVAPGRTIYTDGGGARIKYVPDDKSGSGGLLVIPENSEAEFDTTMNIEVVNGNVLLPGIANSVSTVNLADLKGKPVIPGSKLSVDRKAARADIAYFNGAKLEINGPATYEAKSIGPKADEYSVNLSHENGWYYARLGSIDGNGEFTKALITLFSPQIAADTEAPNFTIGQSIRVPVYLTQTVDMSQYVNDVSGIKDLWVDTDLSKDSDNDSVKENDRDSDQSGSIVRTGSRSLQLDVGPSSTIGDRTIRIWATDENGNTGYRDVTLSFYAPVPNIWSFTGMSVAGSLDEKLQGEPVDIVRYRNGAITRIGTGATTIDKGAFQSAMTAGNGVALKFGSGIIANIDEFSGIIEPKAAGLTVSAEPATSDAPMSLLLRDKNGQVLYREAFGLSTGTPVESASSLTAVQSGSLGIVTQDPYSFVKNGPDAPSLPNGGYVVTADRKAVAGIAQDGNVYLLSKDYHLAYRADNGRIIIEVRDSKNSLAASIVYAIHAEFIVK